MKALIIGATGQVGKRIAQACAARSIPWIGTGHSRHKNVQHTLDITNRAAVNELIAAHSPCTVFLSSALSAVDYCETHPEDAHRINIEGVRNVTEACRAGGSALLFISSDYVFDGRGGPYSETDTASPESVYGKTKLEGERIVLGLPGAVAARTSVVYDWDPDSVNFAMQMIKRLTEKQPTRVVSDQWSHPTLARNLADVLLELAQLRAAGIFHVVGDDYLSRFDFAVALARRFNLDASLLTPIATAELNQPARRPLKSDLKTDKVRGLVKTALLGVKAGLESVHFDGRNPHLN